MPLRQDSSRPSVSPPRLCRVAAAVLTLCILPAVLSGCSGGDPDPPELTLEAGAALITIVDFDYETTGTIEPGDEVTVVNQDDVMHTVTSDREGLFDVEVGAGEVATFTAPEEPGDYSYYCIPHPAMVSVLTVE